MKRIDLVRFPYGIADVVMEEATPEKIIAYVKSEANNYLNIRISNEDENVVLFDGYSCEDEDNPSPKLFEYYISKKRFYVS